MKTVGIIAEYNPFHNGHAYQIKEAKKASGASHAIVVMSGNFTQRGIPAILDKYSRAKMALSQGADMVIELPTLYSTATAELFAYGAVLILHALHVDAISFGAETADLSLLLRLSNLSDADSDLYRESLKAELKKGNSYPVANANVYRSLYSLTEEEFQILSSSNSILALEYLKALKKLSSDMEIYPIKRQGNSYLDLALNKQSFASADAIRKATLNNFAEIESYVSPFTYETLNEAKQNNTLLFQNDFSGILLYKLLSMQEESFEKYADINTALSDKIGKNLFAYKNWDQFAGEVLKSREMTHSRINRSLLHILLEITKEQQKKSKEIKCMEYVRVLGFKKDSAVLFSLIKAAGVKAIGQLSEWKHDLSPFFNEMLEKDIFCDTLYESVKTTKSGYPMQNEYNRQMILYEED